MIAAIGLCALLGASTFADNRPEPAASAPTPSPTPALPAPWWNVRVELLVVDMPQAKALALLPDLRDPAKIDGAVAQILAAIDRNEATLVGYPILQVADGERASGGADFEKRYPTEFDPPSAWEKAGTPQSSPSPSPLHNVSLPTAFETRNVGLMIKVTPRVVKDGNWIVLDWTSDRTTLPRFDTYITQIMVPQFVRLETESTMAVRNGQRTLLAFQKMPEVENQFELDIVEAWAEPIK